MEVAEATGNSEKILEQIMIERLLDAVIPELRAWLKEQKPQTAEELGNQSWKNFMYSPEKDHSSPASMLLLVKIRGLNRKRKRCLKRKCQRQNKNWVKVQQPPPPPSPKPTTPDVIKNSRPEITCFKCGKKGHLSFNCGRSRNNTSQGYLLCITRLESERPKFPPCSVKGRIGGIPAEIVVK